MDAFDRFLSQMENAQHQTKLNGVFAWIVEKFPTLVPAIKWNQPMFIDHGTYIIGFSVAKHHFSVAPEKAGIIMFSDAIVAGGYDHTDLLFRIKWDRPIDFSLLENIIRFNIADKASFSGFWRSS